MFLATLLSLSIAGGFFWNGVGADVAAWSELFDPWLWVRSAIKGAPYAIWTAAMFAAHEMGHYLACRHYGVPATLPFFLPGPPPLGTFGAVMRIRGRIPHRKALFDIAAAGPIAGLVLALPVYAAGILGAAPAQARVEPGTLLLGQPLVWWCLRPFWGHEQPPLFNLWIGAGWVGLLMTALNLFPVGQLDGGHVAYAVSPRLHRWLAYGALVALLSFVVLQLLAGRVPAYLLWLLVLGWMRDRHPRLTDEFAPLGRARLGLAVLLAVVFVLCLIPTPLRWAGE